MKFNELKIGTILEDKFVIYIVEEKKKTWLHKHPYVKLTKFYKNTTDLFLGNKVYIASTTIIVLKEIWDDSKLIEWNNLKLVKLL